ncbi:hypothetical protein [Tabrizicola sp.]|uniref:hypothetical protein n=1 Tax=Tabrizicola sp. TaxID=2005166 RepID=UPI002FDE875F
MIKAKDLRRLAEVAQLMLDHRLGRLRAAAAELERSRMQLASVNAAARSAEELEPVTAERVAMAYDRWADVRRSELNLVIARQTAHWLEARGEAQTAFGRVQALQGLAERLKDKR